MKIEVKNLAGKKESDITVSDAVFAAPENAALVHDVYVAQSANRRSGSAHTKTRDQRRGGGRKPWKQKGTGNARTGSTRNPIWRGGGVMFGPDKTRNFSKKINGKQRSKALAVVLSDKVRDGKLIVVDSLVITDNKTKAFSDALGALGIDKTVVVGFAGEETQSYRALKNIPRTNGLPSEQLNVFDIANAQYVLLSKAAVTGIEARYADQSDQSAKPAKS